MPVPEIRTLLLLLFCIPSRWWGFSGFLGATKSFCPVPCRAQGITQKRQKNKRVKLSWGTTQNNTQVTRESRSLHNTLLKQRWRLCCRWKKKVPSSVRKPFTVITKINQATTPKSREESMKCHGCFQPPSPGRPTTREVMKEIAAAASSPHPAAIQQKYRQ